LLPQSLIKANDLLSNAKDKISARGLDVELIVESGDARGFIPLVCEKVNADALIMGSRGLGGIKRYGSTTFLRILTQACMLRTLVLPSRSWLLGSVSDHCARNVKCPLVIVRPRDA
jgi:nucleotide-binding universal stress UspA family protein